MLRWDWEELECCLQARLGDGGGRKIKSLRFSSSTVSQVRLRAATALNPNAPSRRATEPSTNDVLRLLQRRHHHGRDGMHHVTGQSQFCSAEPAECWTHDLFSVADRDHCEEGEDQTGMNSLTSPSIDGAAPEAVTFCGKCYCERRGGSPRIGREYLLPKSTCPKKYPAWIIGYSNTKRFPLVLTEFPILSMTKKCPPSNKTSPVSPVSCPSPNHRVRTTECPRKPNRILWSLLSSGDI